MSNTLKVFPTVRRRICLSIRMIFLSFIHINILSRAEAFVKAPTNVTSLEKTSTSLNISWQAVLNVPAFGYKVQYQEEKENGRNWSAVYVCSNRTTVLLEGLKIFTNYTLNVTTFTNSSFSNASVQAIFRTDEGVPTSPPEQITAVNASSTSIYVSWQPVPEEHRHGFITSYTVGVQEEDSRYVEKTYNSTNHSVTVINLNKYKLYFVRVKAWTSKGSSNFSAAIESRTGEDAPDAAPMEVKAFTHNASSIVVSWGPVNASHLNGILTAYKVYWRRADSSLNYSVHTVDVPCYRCVTEVNRTTFTITNLHAFRNYSIQVSAVTVAEGIKSSPVFNYSGEGVPKSPPINITAFNTSSTSINVTWYPPTESTLQGHLKGYEVTYTPQDNSSEISSRIVCDKATSLLLVDLQKYTLYNITVLALTKAGRGIESNITQTWTDEDASNVVPTNVTASPKSNSSLLVKWQIVKSPPQIQIQSLRVYYCEDGQNNWKNVTVASDKLERVIEALLPFTMYKIQVSATTTQEGTRSDTACAKTKQGVPSGPPRNVKVDAMDAYRIRVSWDLVPDKQRNGIIINYLIEVHNITGRIKTDKVSGNASSVVIPGLDVFSNYSARVQAFTIVGAGPFSEFENTTTHETAPPVPVNLTVHSFTSTSIYVTWAPVHLSHPHLLQRYQIKFYNLDLPNDIANRTVDGSTTSVNLTGLFMFTRYGIRVAAHTTQPGNYSEEEQATTKEGVPSKAPLKINLQILGSTRARITWDPVPKQHRNGNITGYRVIYQRTEKSSYPSVAVTTPANTRVVILTSLAKSAEYQIKVLAFTSQGDGKNDSLLFNTSEDAPSRAPTNLTALNRTSPHHIKIKWGPVPKEFMHGKLVRYDVTYQVVEIGLERRDDEPVVTTTADKNALSLELRNLEPYTTYRITVAARTARGPGPASEAVFGETCNCGPRLTTSWRLYIPYVNFSESGEPGQIIPDILQTAVQECCGDCQEHNFTHLDFKLNGRNESSMVNSSRELLENLDENTDFTFPVSAHKEQESYKGGFGYAPIVESAGVAFIVYPQRDKTQQSMVNSLFVSLPVLLLPILMAWIAGVAIWILERKHNPQDFDPSFLRGTWEGIWWSYVSMTTLGYGDRAPLGWKGRIFGVIWILYGLVIIAITMATFTTALTTIVLDSEATLYGSKVAAEIHSPEYNLGRRRNAYFDKDKEYHNMEEVADALIRREVEGILVDANLGGSGNDLFKKSSIKVSEILDYKTAYGIVLSPKATRLRKCFRRYMTSHKAEVFEMFEKIVKPIETSTDNDEEESKSDIYSGDLYDTQSPAFQTALKYASTALGVALVFGLVYEFARCVRKRDKLHPKVQHRVVLLGEMKSVVEEFRYRIQREVSRLQWKHRKELGKLVKMKGDTPFLTAKGKEESLLKQMSCSKTTEELRLEDM